MTERFDTLSRASPQKPVTPTQSAPITAVAVKREDHGVGATAREKSESDAVIHGSASPSVNFNSHANFVPIRQPSPTFSYDARRPASPSPNWSRRSTPEPRATTLSGAHAHAPSQAEDRHFPGYQAARERDHHRATSVCALFLLYTFILYLFFDADVCSTRLSAGNMVDGPRPASIYDFLLKKINKSETLNLLSAIRFIKQYRAMLLFVFRHSK